MHAFPNPASSRRHFLQAAASLPAGCALGLSSAGAFAGGSDRIRVGLVGCGGRGRQLARYVAGVDGMQLVAAADLTAERRELARAELGEIAVYPDHATMMREARLDIALLGTTGPLHAAITRDLCAMGIGGIYCEKPMACSLADAEQIIADCAASGTIFMMGHQRRWTPEICGLRDALRSGIIGRVTHGSMFWATGRVGSNGTHFFDALNFILDSQPVEVVGRLVHGGPVALEYASRACSSFVDDPLDRPVDSVERRRPDRTEFLE